MYYAVCFVYSFFLPAIALRLGRKLTHSLSLLCGAAGLLSVALVHDKYLLLVSMSGVGIAWASILSMPYAMLANAIPAQKMGFYMGVFNFFIVIPQILASLGLGLLMRYALADKPMNAVLLGGVSMLVAGLAVGWVAKSVEAGEGKAERVAEELAG